MISEQTRDYLVRYLSACIEPSAPLIGIRPKVDGDGNVCEDKSPSKLKVAKLCEFFRKYLYEAKEFRGNFRMSRSGQMWVFNGRWYENAGNPDILQDIIHRVLVAIEASSVYCEFAFEQIYKNCKNGMEFGNEFFFVPDRRYVVFSNGVLDVKRDKFKMFYDKSPKDVEELGEVGAEEKVLSMNYWARSVLTDLVLDFEYDTKAVSPLWNSKLIEIIPRECYRDALQKFCGMMLADRSEIKFEYAAFIVGPGSNGKSVIASAISSVFGSQYFGKFEPKQVLKNGDAMFNMAALDGMIANFTDDLSKEDISGGMFKRFVSGEEFPARHPYGHIVFKVKAPLMLCCTNSMPVTTDNTWGYHRRILQIESTDWKRDESEKDPMLAHKLSSLENRKAIFNWIYEGYRTVIRDGGQIMLMDEVVAEQKERFEEGDSVRKWLRDSCYVRIDDADARPTDYVMLKDLYAKYRAHCQDRGLCPQSDKSLSAILLEKGFIKKRCAQGYCYIIRQDEMAYFNPVESHSDLPFPKTDIEDKNLPF